jgi:hypothetical protein
LIDLPNLHHTYSREPILTNLEVDALTCPNCLTEEYKTSVVADQPVKPKKAIATILIIIINARTMII